MDMLTYICYDCLGLTCQFTLKKAFIIQYFGLYKCNTFSVFLFGCKADTDGDYPLVPFYCHCITQLLSHNNGALTGNQHTELSSTLP